MQENTKRENCKYGYFSRSAFDVDKQRIHGNCSISLQRWLRPLILQSILLGPIQLKCCLSLKNVQLVMLQDIYMLTKFAFTFHEFSLINSINSRSIKAIKKVFDASSVKYLESNRKIRQLCTPYLHIFF